jgi:hypothetical protein
MSTLPISLTRKTFITGDVLTGDDFTNGFVQDASVDLSWASSQVLDFRCTTGGLPTKLRLRNIGTGSTSTSALMFQNEDGAGAALSTAVLASNAAGASQFAAGQSGGVQLGTAENRPLELISNGQPILTIDATTVAIQAGKTLKLGAATQTLVAPNKSIAVKDSSGNTILLACYQ